MLLLFAATVLLAHDAAAAEFTFDTFMTPEEKQLMDWVLSEGASLRVTIGRNADGVRGLFTTMDVKKGEVLLDIPEHIILSVKNTGAAEAAPVLLKELSTPCSRLLPYMKVLPTKDEVLSGYNWPEEYIPYLADEMLADQITSSFQRHVREVLIGAHNENMEITIPEAVGRANITYEHYKYMTSLLTTRTFSIRKAALSMVPIADLANHDSRDINSLDNTQTPGFRIVAGRDLAKGEEVTITYGSMRPDELLLYYGFLEERDSRMLLIDHPKYKPYETDSEQLGDAVFLGTADEVELELARLKGILHRFEGRLEELGPIPEQPNPYVASMIRGLHAKRSKSLRAEIARLTMELDSMSGKEL